VNTTADVVVVGGGLEGAASAWALAQRGVTDVVVCERSTVASGMTGKSSGIVRCHYGVSSLAAMANRGLAVFENAEEILGADVGFRQVGYVVGVGEQNVDALRASLAAQRGVGVRTEEIDRSEVAKLWPTAYLDDFAAFGWEERGGYGDAYLTAMAFASAARRDGVRIRQNAPVTEVLVDGGRVGGVRLADSTTISTRSVVVAAGPWSTALLAPLGVELPMRVHREAVILLAPGLDLGPVPVLSDLVRLQYLRPELTDGLLFGDSDLAELEDADPDDYRDSATPEAIDIAVEKISHRFPGLPDAAITSTYAGCYDVTPDFNPVISTSGIEGLWVAAGFSGHGFKISPAVGELVADLVIDGKSNDEFVPDRDFRLSRFAEGDLLETPFPYVGAGEMR
jgi:sarcosine oxidase subunit beta